MKRSSALAALAVAVTVGGAAVLSYVLAAEEPKLVKVAKAGWAPRDSAAEFVYKDKLWIVGGWKREQPHMLYDAWNSGDGVEWEPVGERAAPPYPDLTMSLVHKDRMWILGGGGEPDWPVPASNAIYASSDGKQWDLITPDAGWTPRFASAAVEFKGKLWVMGGLDFDEGMKNLKNDVWSSSDGKNWELVTQAPWAPRAFHSAVVFKGKIWVMGGGSYKPDYYAFNDVWSSEDGKHWKKVSDAPWSSRIWFSTVVYQNRMWVIGGWDKKDGNYGDIWHSSDGVRWNRLVTATQWRPRHEHSAYVFQDKIWVAGGHADPLTNEVWVIEASRIQLWRDQVLGSLCGVVPVFPFCE